MAGYQDFAGGAGVTPGGHYRMGFKSGAVTGLSAGNAIFAFRWVDTVRFCRLLRLQVSATINTAFGTAQVSDVEMFRAQNWATAPSAGVSLTAPTTNNNMMADVGTASPMAQATALFPTFSNSFAIANTGALTTGSPTVDTNPLAFGVFNVIALGSSDRVTLYDVAWANEYPLTFGNQEGFTLNVPTAQGATGVVVYYVNLVFVANNNVF